MKNEMEVLDLQKTMEKQICSLRNYEGILLKFQQTIKSLRQIEEKKIAEYENFSNFLDKFYNKECIFRSFSEKLVLGIQKEKMDTEQMVVLVGQFVSTEQLKHWETAAIFHFVEIKLKRHKKRATTRPLNQTYTIFGN